MSFDTDRFIIEIEQRQALWDCRCADYSNRVKKAKAWEELCDIFMDNFKEMDAVKKNRAAVDLQRKWKSLRDSFRRELAKSKEIKSGSAADTGRKEYIYFQQLSFLLPICETRPSQATPKTEEASDFGAEESNPKFAAPSRPVQQTYKTRKRKSTLSCDALLIQNLAKRLEMKTNEPEDADKHFLLSLLPHFKVIPDDMKLEVQGEFLAVLSRYKQRMALARQQYLPAPTQAFPGPSSASFPQSQSFPYNTRPLVSPPFQQIATEQFSTNPKSASQATSPSSDTSSIWRNISCAKMAKKAPMTDEERSALVQKLQDDLEDFVAEKSKAARKKREANPEREKSIEEIIEELEGHPAFLKEIDLTKPLHPDVAGLMQLKYESEDPTARATSYKEDGNDQFKKKQYKIAIDNYTEAIKSKSPESELNAILYANRAAAQYFLHNYRSSFNDCICARKFQPDHLKAIVRGSNCCFHMRKYADAIQWCDAGLLIEPENSVLLDLRNKSDIKKREQERDERKQAAKERKEAAEERKLLSTIQKRNINLGSMKVSSDCKLDPLLLTSLESHNPTNAKVYEDDDGVLHWPVIFLYPEYAQTDFINAFNEEACFLDHLENMFGPDVEPPSWDEEKKYTAENIEIYFENREEEKLYSVSHASTLLAALRHKKYIVYAGTPGFIIVVKGSKFKDEFCKRYK